MYVELGVGRITIGKSIVWARFRSRQDPKVGKSPVRARLQNSSAINIPK